MTPTPPPTEPGWYYARWRDRAKTGHEFHGYAVVALLSNLTVDVVDSDYAFERSEFDWFGPVPMPGERPPVTAAQRRRAVVAAHAARTSLPLDSAARQLEVLGAGHLALRTAERIADAVLAAALAPGED